MSVSNRCSQTRVAPAMAVRGAVLAVILAFPGPLHALTPGKDGSLTVTAANTVLNRYAVLAANAAAGATSLTVANPGGAYGLNPATLTAGDFVMVYQAQGATIDGTDTPSYGTVTSLNGAGNYELIGVTGVVVGSPSTINLEGGCGGLRNAYTAAGHTQVIRVPQYVALTINAGASVVAPAWDGQTGGVVAIHVRGAATLNGPMSSTSAVGRGFRGGVPVNQTSGILTPATGYAVGATNDGAAKGESVAGVQATFGRGAPANGGGGGNRHNAPGGGGANGDNGRSWWITVTRGGQGVMDGAVTGAIAWTVDQAYIDNGGRADELQWRRARRLRVREQGDRRGPGSHRPPSRRPLLALQRPLRDRWTGGAAARRRPGGSALPGRRRWRGSRERLRRGTRGQRRGAGRAGRRQRQRHEQRSGRRRAGRGLAGYGFRRGGRRCPGGRRRRRLRRDPGRLPQWDRGARAGWARRHPDPAAPREPRHRGPRGRGWRGLHSRPRAARSRRT